MRKTILLLLVVVLNFSCSSDSNPDETTTRINLSVNDEETGYVEIKRLVDRVLEIRTNKGNGDFTSFHKGVYEDGELVAIQSEYTAINNPEDREEYYNVANLGDRYVLTGEGLNKKEYLFEGTFVDRYRIYFGEDDEFYNETIFERNSSSNVDEIVHNVNNQDGFTEGVFGHVVNSHEAVAENFFDFENLVYNFAFGVYDAEIGQMLGLSISRDAGMSSDFILFNGEIKMNYITCIPIKNSENQIISMDCTISDFPDNTYKSEFEY